LEITTLIPSHLLLAAGESLMTITFRPHHFLCSYCFKGNGYSSEFTKNFANIMQHLNSQQGDDAVIEVVNETDSICAPCPHRQDKLCETQEKIVQLDRAHAEALGIQPGEKITWKEAKKRIHERMTLQTFHHICEPCEWKKAGICESVLNQVIK
jgi:hypothetical protein